MVTCNLGTMVTPRSMNLFGARLDMHNRYRYVKFKREKEVKGKLPILGPEQTAPENTNHYGLVPPKRSAVSEQGSSNSRRTATTTKKRPLITISGTIQLLLLLSPAQETIAQVRR
ncbi:UNVERIFIED_CONTAM: hypothetical protein K2H54_066474 [Gekko kuhli]